MKKQIVSIVLAVSMLVSMLTAFMLPAVAKSDATYEVMITDDAIKIDGAMDSAYLESTKISSVQVHGSSRPDLSFEAYAVADYSGIYIWVNIVGESTYVNTNEPKKDYLQIYYNMSADGQTTDIGYFQTDYNKNLYCRNQSVYENKAPEGTVYECVKTGEGWAAEVFLPWRAGSAVYKAMQNKDANCYFGLGFQYNDDTDGDGNWNAVLYDNKGGGDYWSDYSGLSRIEFVKTFGRLSKTNVFLDGDIALDYNVSLGEKYDISKTSVRFTITDVNGNKSITTVKGTLVDAATDTYNFSYGLAPHRMNDKVKAELIYDGKVIHSRAEYTVAKFIIDTYNATQEDLGLTANQYEAMKVLALDMLNYGALAQEYKAYDVENLVNKGYEADIYSYDIVYDEIVKSAKTPGYDGTDFVSVNMYFDSASRLCFKVKTNDPENTVVSVYAGNGKSATVIPLVAENYNAEEDVYTVYTDIIDPANYDHNYIVRLEHVEDKGTDWESYEIIQSVKCSVNAYLAEMVARAEGSTDANTLKMAAFARAAYTLGVSARAMEAA